MSTALAKASALKPEIRLAQAVSEFEAELTAEQKAEFRTQKLQSTRLSPSSHDVMRLTAEIDRSISKKYGGQCFGPRFTYFLQGVQQFAALGDIIIGGSQNLIACGVWSIARMTILSITIAAKYADKLSTLFMEIGRTSPRYQAMALLYPRSTKLQAYLFEYFIVVVALCRHIHRFGLKSVFGQLASAMDNAKLQEFRSELDQWATNIKEEVSVHEHQENSGFRAIFKRTSQTSSDQSQIKARLRVLNFCSTYNHQTAWKQTKKAGRTSFFEQRSEYQTWRDSTTSCTLVCTGKLGSGKSVLLANIVDDIILSSGNKDRLVTYFFCRDDVPESLQARTVIGSLAQQMLSSLPNLVQLSKSFDVTQTNDDTDVVLQLLGKCVGSKDKAYVVLDGLDECSEVERETLLAQLLKLQSILKVQICTSIRIEPHVDTKLFTRRLARSSVLVMPDENPDIDRFIATELDRCLDSGRLVLGDATLIIEISDALVKGSQGMFLWATLQVQSLCDMKTDKAIREALADLPKDLPEIFRRILYKSGSKNKPLQEKVLKLLLAACRPLTTDELREALSVAPGNATWDPSSVLNDVYSALSSCGCLVIVNEEEYTVGFVHHSVRLFIQSGLIGDNMAFTFAEAQRIMGDIIVTYLGYGVFGKELSTARVQPVEAQPTPFQIVHATMGNSSFTAQLARKLLRSRNQPTFDMSKVLAEAQGRFAPSPSSSFKFHVYARSHWLDHIPYVSRNDAAILKCAARLLQAQIPHLKAVTAEDVGSVLRFTLEATDFYRADRRSDGAPPMTWAVRKRRLDIIDLYSTSGDDITNLRGASRQMVDLLLGEMDLTAADADGYTPISWAANYGDRELFKRLMHVQGFDKAASDIKFKARMGCTPLMFAAESGNRDVVELLVATGAADVNAKDSVLQTALVLAIKSGHKDVVELLLRDGRVNVEAKDGLTRTPLVVAASSGKRDMVELLLGAGRADVEAADRYGTTPLAIAAGEGHVHVVELLLNTGKADVEARDNLSWTPLHMASGSGHIDVVELLLTTGKANAKAKDNKGRTPKELAAEEGQSDIVQLFEQYDRRTFHGFYNDIFKILE